MLFKKRERFDRTDVPQVGPYTKVIGIAVCVVVLVAFAITVKVVWDRVQLETRMGVHSLSKAVKGQATPVVPEGWTATQDDVYVVLMLAVDGKVDDATAPLTSARLLSVNRTAGTATVVNIDPATHVRSQETSVAIADLYASSGYATCARATITAAGVKVSSVIVSSGDILADAAALSGADRGNLLSVASSFLPRIRTNMNAAGLVDLAHDLGKVGIDGITVVDAPTVPETAKDDAGNVAETGAAVLDRVGLANALGLISHEG